MKGKLSKIGINAYQVWGEALHGLATSSNPKAKTTTSFPNSLAKGSAWDPALMEREASFISEEARGVNSPVITGLTVKPRI
jgi:beta-glucosidase